MAYQDTNPFGVLATQTSQSPAAAGSPPQVQLLGTGADEPQEVVIENVGFLALNGDTKVKIFAKGYDSDSLPLSSVSLFAVASRSGLFAAATHSDLIVGSTLSLREAFSSTSEGVANYRPQLSLSLPAKISHVAFTADEFHLVLGSASGGLAVYSVNDLNSNSNAQPLFQLGTDGVGLREVKPNPATPEFVAIVTIKGDVQMVNINARGFEQGLNGPVLKSGASTVAWSQRGKQIVCGMGDGTGWQMTPRGEGKAILPSVPGLENYFVSSVVWLENDLFITTHTPVPSDPQNNESIFHVLFRHGSTFQYTRLPDPVPPFGLDSRPPPYFFHALIKQYAPSLKDMVIFSNTCSSDIGLVSRFSTPISGDPAVPAETWITSSIGDDTRRAQLPLSGESFQDTSIIGMALDLGSKDNVKRPVGGEEIEESPGPLPVLMVLNHEGLLCAWHVVYNDAIENGEKYTGMMVYSQQDLQPQQQQQQPPRPSTPPRPTPFSGTFGSPNAQTPLPMGGLGFGFGARPGPPTSSFTSPQVGISSPGLPTGSVFGQSSSLGSSFPKPAFGQPAFGQPATLGASTASAFGQSSWGAASSGPATAAITQTAGTAKPAFGQPATLGASTLAPAFGAPTALGLAKPTAGTFGQVSPLGATTTGGSVFGSGSALGNGGGASGFGAYANKGGFAAAATAAPPSNGTPIWGAGKAVNTTNTPSVFGTPSNASSPFGLGGASNFRISSGFKADGSATDDGKKTAAGGSFGAFGVGLGDALSTAQSAPRSINDQGLRDADMDADSDAEQDKASDLDEDEDIITPGVRQQGGPSQAIAPKPATLPSGAFGSGTKPLPRGIFGNANASSNVTPNSSPFASVNKSTSSPFGTATGTPPVSPFANVPPTKSPFAALPNTGSPLSNWTGLKQTSNPFGSSTHQSPFAPSPKPAFGTTGLGAFAPKPQTPEVKLSPKPLPSPIKEPTPEAAPLPPDFTSAKTKPEPVKDEVPDAPLPPDFTAAKREVKQEIAAEDAPLPPDFTETSKKDASPDRVAAEEAPLPPDFTTPAKVKQPEEEIPSLPEEGLEDDEDEAYDEENDEDEADEAEQDEEEEEDEEEEDEGEDEGDEDDEGWEQDSVAVTPKGPTWIYEPKPKLPSTSPSTSDIFNTNTSFKDTIGAVDKAAPFAGLFSKPAASKDTDHRKPAAKSSPSATFGGAKTRSPATHGHTPPGKDKDKRSGSGMGAGGMFNKTKKPGVTEIGKAASVSSGASFFPAPTPAPLPSFSVAPNRPASAPSVFSQNLPAPGKIPAPSATVPFGNRNGKPDTTSQFSAYNKPPPVASPFGSSNFVSATSKPVRSSPLAVVPAPVSVPVQHEQRVEKEEPKEDSDLDLDKEFSDREDEKIRRKLERGKVKPLENVPKFKSIKEVEVANDFNAVFDSIYLSGNMMVNRLGLTVRGLAAYHMSQNQLLADVKHESAKDMKHPKDWKLCELEKVRGILEELVDGVKKENRGNEDLEAQYEAANKGFIKLDTKDAEIKRLLAVHNDAQAAAIARARPLTPEQLLQQRKLRKEYTRVEKLLKDAEKEVTQLKAKIASRDKNKSGPVVPPTVEAVRNTIMKLTGMVERKNGDIECLEERLRRVKLKSRSVSATPGRSRGITPERTMRGETPQRFGTPERSVIGGAYGYAPTPVLAVTDPVDVAEAREEMKARREMGKKLRGVLEKSGPRMTGGQGQGQRFGQGQQGQGYGLGR